MARLVARAVGGLIPGCRKVASPERGMVGELSRKGQHPVNTAAALR
jgi:hypothetical protein